MSERVFQIGAGKVGRGLHRAFSSSGITVVALHGRRPSVGATSYGAIPISIADANVVLVSVRDGDLDGVMHEILDAARASRVGSGAAVLHTSPVAEPQLLEEIRRLGFSTGTFHPLIPFTEPDRAVSLLRGAWIGIDGDATARATSRRLAAAVGARTLDIPPGKKAAYHAATVMASTFPSVLASLTTRLLQSIGMTASSSAQAVESLMSAAMASVVGGDPDAALSGPVVRGDAATIARHINAIKSLPSALPVYRALSNAAVEIAERRGLDPEKVAALRGTIAATGRAAAVEPTGL